MRNKRIKLVIDHLGSGGAQRQICNLAICLKRRGFEVEVLTYWPHDFYASLLAKANIPLVYVSSHNRLHLIYAMRKAIRKNRPQAVIAFLSGPSLLVELAGLPKRNFAIIVSERSLDVSSIKSLRRSLKYFFHRFTDAVVSNSHAQRDRIKIIAPYLEKQNQVIINSVDLDCFKPATSPKPNRPYQLQILVLARLVPHKNPLGLLEAVAMLHRDHPALDLVVNWYGGPPVTEKHLDLRWVKESHEERAGYYRELKESIAQKSLQKRFRLHPAAQNVVPLYHEADAVCLPSFYEGTSNVICEAMACGIPLLTSRVSDNPRLVKEGRNGFLFDPSSPQDIANVIMRFADTSPAVRRTMGKEGRKMAESIFSPDLFANRFIKLIDQVSTHRH